MAHCVTVLSGEMDYIGRKLRLFESPEGIAVELVQRDDWIRVVTAGTLARH